MCNCDSLLDYIKKRFKIIKKIYHLPYTRCQFKKMMGFRTAT